MKQIFKAIITLVSFNLYSQDIIELRYEKFVVVDAFNNFGDEPPLQGDEIGEFIFSPIEKKLTINKREISNLSQVFSTYEYAINNTVFLILGTTYNVFNQNDTELFDFRGKLAGKIEFNAENQTLAITNWETGKVITRKYWISSVNFKKMKSNSIPKEISINAADVIISKPNLNQSELFGRATDFINKYYKKPRVKNIDSSQKAITIESYGWDVFDRNAIQNHRPIVEIIYSMSVTATDGTLKVNFEHKDFLVNGQKYYINVEDVLNEKKNPLLFKEDKKGYINYYKRIIKSLEYYIDKEEIVYFPANSNTE